MKIKLTESQFERLKKIGFLTEQTNPFYAQEKTSSGAINPNSDYRYSGGGPMARPQGAIDVKYLFPSQVPQGGYPQKLTKQEVSDILAGKAYKGVVRNSLNNTVAPQITPQIRDAIQGKPPAPLPYDWQREEQNYAAFNEPLGKPDRMVTGKYRGNRGPLPAQTNKYFYDPNAEGTTQQKALNSKGQSVTNTVKTKGAWVVKSLANVDLWRDVPRGYYPPDYPKALEFDKNQSQSLNAHNRAMDLPSGESTAVAKVVRMNPYLNPQFPLGLSQEAKRAYDANVAAQRKELTDFRQNSKKPVAGSDYFASVDAETNRKMEGLVVSKINTEIQKIDSAFGRYVAAQKEEEGYDWVGFLLLVASVLPVVGPAATVINVGYNLVNAVRAYEKGDYTEAGLNTLFAVLPGLSRTLKGSNLLNVLRAGGQEAVALEKYLAQNASTMYREVVGKLTQSVEQNLANATSQELLFLEKSIGKFTEQYSLKGAAKATAGEVDKFAKGKTDVINPLTAYIPGM
jgi:hypothetical protein